MTAEFRRSEAGRPSDLAVNLGCSGVMVVDKVRAGLLVRLRFGSGVLWGDCSGNCNDDAAAAAMVSWLVGC